MRLRVKYEFPTLEAMHAYEVRPRKDKRGVDLISDALPFRSPLVRRANCFLERQSRYRTPPP